MPQTTILEALMTAAQRRSEKRGISIGKAYEEVLMKNPQAYARYCQEKADSTIPGTTAARDYSRKVERLIREIHG